MQENNKLWLEIKEMFETSQTEVLGQTVLKYVICLE